jgi:hypothetical protein
VRKQGYIIESAACDRGLRVWRWDAGRSGRKKKRLKAYKARC